jgi:hypothetical protein
MAHESAEFLASGAAPGVVGTLELESAELDEAEFALDTRPLEFISQPERHARTPMQIIMMIRVMMILFMIMSFQSYRNVGKVPVLPFFETNCRGNHILQSSDRASWLRPIRSSNYVVPRRYIRIESGQKTIRKRPPIQDSAVA